MDYTNLEFADNSFDVVFTLETLVHAYDINKVLWEFMRVLKPGGRLVLFEYSMAPERQWEDVLAAKSAKVGEGCNRWTEWVIEKAAMFSLKKFRHGALAIMLEEADFVDVKAEDISAQVFPSLNRLTRTARLPYLLISLFRLQNVFINTTVAAEWFPLITNPQDDLFRYNIISARKLTV
ncbi:methyltransferase domain-containing protein [Patescibacteria group bacterium]|nr:methyltransferase domain-containing protein [Patescibacteria group bacterium]